MQFEVISDCVPRDELDEVFVERDASAGVEDAAEVARHEVGRHNLVLGVAEDALHRAFSGSLHRRLDRVVRRLQQTQAHSAFYPTRDGGMKSTRKLSEYVSR